MKSIANLSQGDVEAVLSIIDRMTNVDVQIEVDGMKLHVRKFSDKGTANLPDTVSPQSTTAHTETGLPSHALQPETPASANALTTVANDTPSAAGTGLLEIRAPMLGRFYRAASPSEPPLADVGSKVGPEDPVCVIEVMKLFSTIPAGITGTIVEIVAADGELVECDAVLFRVRPQ